MLNQRPLFVSKPVVEKHGDFLIVRDDLLPGGTKSRFIDLMFEGVDELVYASPAEGGAQTALALAASRLGKRFTLFVAARQQQHERVLLTKELGAKVVEIETGYLTNVQSRAHKYAVGSRLFNRGLVHDLGFGLESQVAINVIARAARLIPKPSEIWYAAGSGTLGRGIAKAWPDVKRCAVQVGHQLWPREAGATELFRYPLQFNEAEEFEPPFPCDPHYDRKAYRLMLEKGTKGATFWNVAGPASTYRKVK